MVGCFAQEVDGDVATFRVVVKNTRATAALAADSKIEGTITLFLEFFNRDVLADFDAATDFNA